MQEEQLKKIHILCDQSQKKIRVLQTEGRLNVKMYNEVMHSYNQIYTELILMAQQLLSNEFGLAFDRVFNSLREITQIVFHSKKEPSPNQQQINISLQVPQFLNALQLGSVQVIEQYGQPSNMKPNQIPWNDYKVTGSNQKERLPKLYSDKQTSTTDDFYQNISEVLQTVDERDSKMNSLVEYADQTVQLMNEALQNRIKFEPGITERKELDKLLDELQTKKIGVELILKEAELDPIKMNQDNFEIMEQKIMQHIKEVQKATADKVVVYCMQKFRDTYKQQSIVSNIKNKIKTKLMPQNQDCRCQYYVNEIINYKGKIEHQSNEIIQLKQLLMERENHIRERDIEFKMIDNLYKQSEQEKIEYKKKYEINIKDQQRQKGIIEKKNSENQLSMSDPDNQLNASINLFRKKSIDKANFVSQQSGQQNQTQQEILTYFQVKSQLIDRIVSIVNVLEPQNQQKRISQMQYLLTANKQPKENQIAYLSELCKELEENDLLQPDVQEKFRQQTIQDLDQSATYNNNRSLTKSQYTSPVIVVEPNASKNFRRASYQNIDQVNSQVDLMQSSQRINFPKKTEESEQQQIQNSNTLQVPTSSIKRRGSTSQMSTKPIGKSKTKEIQQIESGKLTRTNSQRVSDHSRPSIRIANQTQKSTKQIDPIFNPYGSNLENLNQDMTSQTDRRSVYEGAVQTDRFNQQEGGTQSDRKGFNEGGYQTDRRSVYEGAVQTDRYSDGDFQIQTDRFNSTRDDIMQTDRLESGRKLDSYKSQNSNEISQHLSPQRLGRKNSVKLQSVQSETESDKQVTFQQDQKSIHRNFRLKQNTSGQESLFSSEKNQQSITTPKSHVMRLKEEYENKVREEKIFFDNSLHDMPETQENQIIQKALSNSQGFHVASEVNEDIMASMYNNLHNHPEIIEAIQNLSGDKSPKIGFQDFKLFMNKMQAQHRKCGKDCIHLMRYQQNYFKILLETWILVNEIFKQEKDYETFQTIDIPFSKNLIYS